MTRVEEALAAGALLAAMLVSLAVGLACLAWLVRLVRSMALHHFAWYLWGLALLGAVFLLQA